MQNGPELDYFKYKNGKFIHLNSCYDLHLVTIDRGHVFDLLTKYEVHTVISQRDMGSESLDINCSDSPVSMSTLPFETHQIDYVDHFWMKNRKLVDLK